MSVGWDVGESSVAEAYRLRLGEVQFPKGKLRCCYRQLGSGCWAGRKDKCQVG